jgi:hypothetical protein
MKVLIACEFSGIVRQEFGLRGHDAMSCDLLDTELEGGMISPHFMGDIFFCLEMEGPFDLMIAFPPCTHLASSGARWFKDKRKEQEAAIEFVKRLAAAPVPHIAIENPIGVLSTRWRKPDQIIQPWMFGHPESKATCLWLKGLPLLKPTKNVKAKMESLPLSERTRVHYASPGPDRWKERSRTLIGIAKAMAEQWG